jgi:hypothetical protein
VAAEQRGGHPRLYLTADPIERVEIPTLFEPDGVACVLEEPPTLREPTLGWDLWTLDRARSVEGRKRHVMNGYRKRVALYTGGSLAFVAGCVEFLSWPRNATQFFEDPALNGLGLIELTLNFTLTVAAVRDYFQPPPERLRIWSGFRDLELPSGRRVYLESYVDDGRRYEAPATSEDFAPLAFDWSDGFPKTAAYGLLLQTHEWFGCDGTTIPFLDHERLVVDSASLRRRLAGIGLSAVATGWDGRREILQPSSSVLPPAEGGGRRGMQPAAPST